MGGIAKGCASAAVCLVLAATCLAAAPRVRLGDEVDDGRPAVRWRGFNLLEMFNMGWSRQPKEFREEDFQIVSGWGFNFVRLPMDYRYWIKDGDSGNWETFDEEHLKYVDRAIALGRKYGVHVSINMHRCPGYTVADPKERTDLFSDAETLRVCCAHWAMFARRYRGIPNESLSFNLFNEPPAMKESNFVRVVQAIVDAIRAEDPARFIVVDAISYGNIPSPLLAGIPGVGQATRGYKPMELTHYRAPWVARSFEEPVWPPRLDLPRGILAGPGKKDMRSPFRLLDVPAGKLSVGFGRTSGPVTLRFTADGALLRETTLVPDEKDKMWSGVALDRQWDIKQGAWRGSEEFVFEKGVGAFEVSVAKGDWTMPTVVSLVSPDGARKARFRCDEEEWCRPVNFTQRFAGWDMGFRAVGRDAGGRRYPDDGREWIYRKLMKDWDPVIGRGAFCFVGEFGAWKNTPHETTLRYLEDYLALWKERNMGWALWNLRGGHGVLDSGREDVEYEDFRGHKLDRKMLELLQRY